VNGTRIDIFDRIGIQRRDPNDEAREDFEAAWGPEGATYLHVPRWDDDVAAIVRECPERLAGRTSLEVNLTPDEAAQRFPETLMFNNRMHDPALRMANVPLPDAGR
jgi:hypothetical protein